MENNKLQELLEVGIGGHTKPDDNEQYLKKLDRELALEELKKLHDDTASFIFEWMDEIEDLTSGIRGQREPNNQMELEL